MRNTIVATLMVAAALTAGTDVSAQTCSGTNSCTVTSTASVAVPALVNLSVSGGGAITLTPTIFLRTLYPAGYDDNPNSAGSYAIPLVFTLSAP